VRVTGFELLPIRATSRTVWLIVRLRKDTGAVEAEHPFPTLIPVGDHRLPMGNLPWSERHTGLPQERHALNASDRIGCVFGTPPIPFNPKAFEANHSR